MHAGKRTPGFWLTRAVSLFSLAGGLSHEAGRLAGRLGQPAEAHT